MISEKTNFYFCISFWLYTILSCSTFSQVKADSSHFPLAIGNQWVYKEAQYGYADTITIVDTQKVNGKIYYAFEETFYPRYLWFREEAIRVYIVDTTGYELSTSFRELLLYDFSINVGDTIYVPVTNVELICDYHGKITLNSKNDSVITSAGTFLNCYYFSQDVPCFDAGRFAEWFAPGIGRVSYDKFNIARILKYYLSYSNIITEVIEHPVFYYELSQNFPNPFNPLTRINYQLPELSFVTIRVYDVLGNEIAIIVNEEKPAGNHQVEFNATGLSSGIYFYKIKAGDFIQTKKMLLIK